MPAVAGVEGGLSERPSLESMLESMVESMVEGYAKVGPILEQIG